MHILSSNNNDTIIPSQHRSIFPKYPRHCWYGYKYIPCDKLVKKMIATSTSTKTKPLITKICSQFNDHLPYSKATSSFFQQHQLIIFVAFIILCIGLLIITSLTLIYFILETRRRQKRHRSRYTQSDNYSDVFMFKRMNNQQERFNYNNNRNDNIMKHNLNNKDIESVPLYYECTTLEHPTPNTPIKEIPTPFTTFHLPFSRYQ